MDLKLAEDFMRRLIDKGLCKKIKGGICLSRKGLDLANEAFMEFL